LKTMDRKTLQIFEAARLCYEMGLSQREVAQDLGVSPATLTRLLKKARALGIVKFTVQPPEDYSRDSDTLARRLEETLSLEEAVVVPSSLRPEVVRKELGFAAARWISGQLKPGTRIGFSGGRSVAEIIPFLKKIADGVEVVQLMGGVSPTEIDIQADVIARNAASRLGGTCHVIHGPAIFPSEKELLQLLKNRIVADVVNRFDELDISVVGFIKETEAKVLSESACVADICGHFFNRQGEECDAVLAKRILGIRLSQLARIPKVCAVAAGNDKIAGIIAACRSGVPKVLVTDTETAEGIVAALGDGDDE
jgi:deoxyribonucleoside regulator